MPRPRKPTRIQIVQIERPKGLPGPLPVSADLTTGIYFRPSKSGQQIIVGSVLEEDEQETVDDPDDYARYADDDFIRQKLHALQHRLPELSYKGSIRGYSGLYTVNSSDVHPVVGPTPLQGFYVAAGFSGHGFKLAPAIGGMVARLLTGDTAPLDTDVSYKSIAYDRSPLEIAGKSVIA